MSVSNHKEDRACGEWDASHPLRLWDSAQAWSDGAQPEERDRETKSFPLLNHTGTEGWEQRCQDDMNTSLIPALVGLPENH